MCYGQIRNAPFKIQSIKEGINKAELCCPKYKERTREREREREKGGKSMQSIVAIERILCEPVRDVVAMHDFDNSFLSPCPRDIRTKDRTGRTGRLSRDRFTFVRSQ